MFVQSVGVFEHLSYSTQHSEVCTVSEGAAVTPFALEFLGRGGRCIAKGSHGAGPGTGVVLTAPRPG